MPTTHRRQPPPASSILLPLVALSYCQVVRALRHLAPLKHLTHSGIVESCPHSFGLRPRLSQLSSACHTDRSDGCSGSCCFATHCAREWGKLFADQAILTEIEKDVSRTYPDLHFLSAAKIFPPLRFPFASPSLPLPCRALPFPRHSRCGVDHFAAIAMPHAAAPSAPLTVSHGGTEACAGQCCERCTVS